MAYPIQTKKPEMNSKDITVVKFAADDKWACATLQVNGNKAVQVGIAYQRWWTSLTLDLIENGYLADRNTIKFPLMVRGDAMREFCWIRLIVDHADFCWAEVSPVAHQMLKKLRLPKLTQGYVEAGLYLLDALHADNYLRSILREMEIHHYKVQSLMAQSNKYLQDDLEYNLDTLAALGTLPLGDNSLLGESTISEITYAAISVDHNAMELIRRSGPSAHERMAELTQRN